MLSETAPSALARFLSRALRRAAWTGGVGVGLLGSVSLSYSESAVGTALRVVAAALETAICRGTRGSISEGAEGPDEPEKREPPSKGFLLEERVLSSSARILAMSLINGSLQRTVYASFNSFLYGGFEYLPLPPHLNYPSEFLLNFIRGSFVCNGSSFGEDGGKGDDKVILLSDPGLLRNFICKVDQIESFVGAGVL